MNIAGISFGYHDASCCILSGGRLLAAAQEERFTRRKQDPSLPRRAFRYCLQEAGLSIADLDCIAYYENPEKKLSRQIWMGLRKGLSREEAGRLTGRLEVHQPQRQIRELLGFDGPIEIGEHHLSHAASAYYFSGFAEAAVLTVDGVGEWATTTYGRGKGTELELFEEVQYPDSLGLLYSAITGYLGFEVNEGEYKVMGLAPYGQARYVEELRSLVELGAQGQYRLNMEYFEFLAEDRMYSDRLADLLGHPPRQSESELLPFHEDVARSLQVVLEEVLLDKVRYLHTRVPSGNLCMAGGVALNCVANGRLLREGPFARLFVQPAAGDAGTALGAAAVVHARLGGGALAPMSHVYLGSGYSSSQVHHLLANSAAQFGDFQGREAELAETVAAHLAAGKVVGWFQGRMEFGPRSLGARSILADPRDPQMRDRINALVKKREAFRPFAPAVLETHCTTHFDLDHASPFMLETCQVVSALELPAITHVDGSARVQTVEPQTAPRFAALLEAFYRRTGCPILLNTSFNMRGEPIVCTPEDAILCFVRSQLDVLVIEDFVVEREAIPPLWQLFAAAPQQAEPQAVSHLVYTLL